MLNYVNYISIFSLSNFFFSITRNPNNNSNNFIEKKPHRRASISFSMALDQKGERSIEMGININKVTGGGQAAVVHIGLRVVLKTSNLYYYICTFNNIYIYIKKKVLLFMEYYTHHHTPYLKSQVLIILNKQTWRK